MKSDIAIIFDSKEYMLFKLVGAELFFISKEQAKQTFFEACKSYKIIFLTETLARVLEEELKLYESKMFPAVLCLPSLKGESGFAYKNLSKKAKTSLGLEI